MQALFEIENVQYNEKRIKNTASDKIEILDSDACNKLIDIPRIDKDHFLINNGEECAILGVLTRSNVGGREYDYNAKYLIMGHTENCQAMLQHGVEDTNDDLIILYNSVDGSPSCPEEFVIGGIRVVNGKLTGKYTDNSLKMVNAFTYKMRMTYKIPEDKKILFYVYNQEDAENDIIAMNIEDILKNIENTSLEESA